MKNSILLSLFALIVWSTHPSSSTETANKPPLLQHGNPLLQLPAGPTRTETARLHQAWIIAGANRRSQLKPFLRFRRYFVDHFGEEKFKKYVTDWASPLDYRLARELHKHGDLDLAGRYYKNAIYINPKNYRALKHYGELLRSQKRISEAEIIEAKAKIVYESLRYLDEERKTPNPAFKLMTQTQD